MYKDNLFQGEVKFLTGGNALNAMSPRALRLNGWDPHTDGIVRMRETQDTLCILYCALESCDSEVFYFSPQYGFNAQYRKEYL